MLMNDNRRHILWCGKQGVLEYNEVLYKKLNFSDKDIKILLQADKEELQEGCYTIDELGVHYHE